MRNFKILQRCFLASTTEFAIEFAIKKYNGGIIMMHGVVVLTWTNVYSIILSVKKT